MDLRHIISTDIADIARLAQELWPDATGEELEADFRRILMSGRDAAFIIRIENAGPVAFAHVSLRREYVEGTSVSPVGYLEGIYVRPEYQKRGIGRKLLAACEAWSRTMHCAEFASDAELANVASITFHHKMGFREVNRVFCFAKKLF